jgi:hypothetical protein
MADDELVLVAGGGLGQVAALLGAVGVGRVPVGGTEARPEVVENAPAGGLRLQPVAVDLGPML